MFMNLTLSVSFLWNYFGPRVLDDSKTKKAKAVPLHVMEALEERGGISPTQSRPRF
jgi:hypothetical protein